MLGQHKSRKKKEEILFVNNMMASLSDQIQKIVDTTIDTYVTKVSTEFNIPKTELIRIWSDESCSSSSNTKTKTTTTHRQNLENELLQQSRSELVEACKTRHLKVSGSKAELIERILNHDHNVTVLGCFPTPNNKVRIIQPTQTAVVNKLIKPHVPVIEVKKNKFNNIEHVETKLVFDPAIQKIIGRQDYDTGAIKPLSPEDIDLCRKFKFSHVIPDNLDVSNLNDDDDDDGLDAGNDDDQVQHIQEEDIQETRTELQEDDDDDEEDDEEDEIEVESAEEYAYDDEE